MTAELHVLAPLRSLLPDRPTPVCRGEPDGIAEVEGEPVTAADLRAALDGVDAICPGGLRAPTGGSLHLDLLGAGGSCRPRLSRGDLETGRAARVPGPPGRDLPVRGARGARRRPRPIGRPPRSGASAGPATGTAGNPAAAAKVGWTELDHVLAHVDGWAADCDNLCCLCRRHHRLKTIAGAGRPCSTSDGIRW